jgi:hypothetical protein
VPLLESKLQKTFRFSDGVVASIIVASLVFGYNAAVTSEFVEPNFRYRHIVELQNFLIAGLGFISIHHWVWIILGESVAERVGGRWTQAIQWMRGLDFFERLSALQLVSLSVSFPLAVFAWWAMFMLRNTAV